MKVLIACLMMLSLSMLMGSAHATPAGVVATVVTSCACANQAALKATATTYINTWLGKTPPGYHGTFAGANPRAGFPGTMLFVVSTKYPISARFRYGFVHWPTSPQTVVVVGTDSDAGAVANDVKILSRSIKMEDIHLRPGQPIHGVDIIEDIGGYLQGRLKPLGVGTSFWHAILTLNLAQVAWAKFEDIVTGQVFTVYSGEVITVYDAAGWSIKLMYDPGVAGAPWQPVPGSVRDNLGNVVNMVNNVPTTSITGGGSADGNPMTVGGGASWNPVGFTSYELPTGSATIGEITVVDGGGGGASGSTSIQHLDLPD